MEEPRYYKLSKYLKERFGGGVQRVTIDAGFTCPNIDGTKSVGGCTFCTDDGSSSGAQNAMDSIAKQVEDGIKKQSRRFGVDKFIAYFQSFTNTYGEVDYLRSLYDEAVKDPRIKVLAIGTRPDCVPEEVIDLLEEYTARGLEVWVDIGVQSSHNSTLEKINRAHTYEDFTDACTRLERRKNPLLRICTHIIMGLADETPEMILETIDKLAQSPIDDLKIHQLCILKETALEIDYLNDEAKVFEDEDEYIPLLAESIARLPENVVIQRVMAEAKPGELVAPMWCDHGLKQNFLNKFHKYMEENDLYQGKHFKGKVLLS